MHFIDKAFKERQNQYFNIQPDSPVFNIIQVIFDSLHNRSVPPVAIDLCPPSNPRAYLMFDHVARNLFFKFLYKKRSFRSWSHKAHLTFQDIEQLRKFRRCFVFLINLPIGVTRGSFWTVHFPFSAALSCTTIDRNLYI